MPIDFTHYSKTTVEMVAGYIARGGKASDEMFLEAIELTKHPLLTISELDAVRRELDPKRQRTGRPRKGSVRVQSVGALMSISPRSDIPTAFLRCLSARLQRQSRRFTEQDRGSRFQKRNKQRERDSLIQDLYREIYDQLDGQEMIVHPILGELDVPKDVMPRSEKALTMVAMVLRDLGFHPPSNARMLNIISSQNSAR